MAATSALVPLGTPAPDFSLPAIDGRVVARDDFAAAPALLVAFLCNHCPYVRHVEQVFGELVGEFPDLAVVGICSNSPAVAPADDTAGLRAQVTRTGWVFPYLVDLDQSVGRAYRAACTPDFFLYDARRALAYRGAMDDSTPGNGKPVTGSLLRHAIGLVLAGRAVPEPHRPSMGCSIKWA
ncbi:thioredoxin family protein [Kitasatospora cinereorecta]|uniref:Thioredoxin family protein n=1 Tax=Kitasatospora cinereorecta TaxID=285560 RepID=A0ABW0V575_9ACTN